MCRYRNRRRRFRCTTRFLANCFDRDFLAAFFLLTSSWILNANLTLASDIFAGSPKQYTVRPPKQVSRESSPLAVHMNRNLRHTDWGKEDLDVSASDQLQAGQYRCHCRYCQYRPYASSKTLTSG